MRFDVIFNVPKKGILMEIEGWISLDKPTPTKHETKFRNKDKWSEYHSKHHHNTKHYRDLDKMLE